MRQGVNWIGDCQDHPSIYAAMLLPRSVTLCRAARTSTSPLFAVRHYQTTYFPSRLVKGYSKQTGIGTYRPKPLSLQQFSRHASTVTSVVDKPTSDVSSPSPLTYTPPTKGIISSLPSSWIPYAELVRLDKPTGTLYLFWPCLFSTLMAAPMASPIAPLSEVIAYSGLFFAGSLIMRGAGCAINDLWDRNLDPHVERTRLRPLARKAITPRNAVLFTGSQLLAGLVVLLQFPWQCFWYAVPSLSLVTIYPLMKRVTNYPQAVLGLTFSWGAIMGFPALGIDLVSDTNALIAASCLYASCATWTMVYDMIYAHMDIKDDVKAGIKSIARAHEHHSKRLLTLLSFVQVGLLTGAGVASGAGPIFFVGSCGGALTSLLTMIYRVNLKNVADCWYWFKNGCLFTGGTVSLGLAGDYLARLLGWYGDEEVEEEEKTSAKVEQVQSS